MKKSEIGLNHVYEATGNVTVEFDAHGRARLKAQFERAGAVVLFFGASQ